MLLVVKDAACLKIPSGHPSVRPPQYPVSCRSATSVPTTMKIVNTYIADVSLTCKSRRVTADDDVTEHSCHVGGILWSRGCCCYILFIVVAVVLCRVSMAEDAY